MPTKRLETPAGGGWGGTVLGVFFILAGAMHFVVPELYVRIVPPLLPSPRLLIIISGVAEIAGGVGLFLPRTRRAAAWGLVLLLIAVFPANVYAAVAHVALPGPYGRSWVQWLRLPLQIPLLIWTWRYTRA